MFFVVTMLYCRVFHKRWHSARNGEAFQQPRCTTAAPSTSIKDLCPSGLSFQINTASKGPSGRFTSFHPFHRAVSWYDVIVGNKSLNSFSEWRQYHQQQTNWATADEKGFMWYLLYKCQMDASIHCRFANGNIPNKRHKIIQISNVFTLSTHPDPTSLVASALDFSLSGYFGCDKWALLLSMFPTVFDYMTICTLQTCLVSNRTMCQQNSFLTLFFTPSFIFQSSLLHTYNLANVNYG